MTPSDRRKKIRRLQKKSERLKHEGDKIVHDQCADPSVGFAKWDEGRDIDFALGYVARHMDLQTGKLSIPLEDEEVA